MGRVGGSLVLVQVLFGINYSMTKELMAVWPPLVWASVRTLVTAMFLVAIARVASGPSPVLSRKFVSELLFLSLFGVVLNQTCIQVGLSFTSTTNASVLTTLTPVFTLVLVGIRGQERGGLGTWMGFGLASLGVLILRHAEDLALGDRTLLGDVLVVGSSASYATFLTLGRAFLREYDQLWATAWLFVVGSLVLAFLSVPYWNEAPLLTGEEVNWGAVVYVLFGGTLIPYLLSNWALSKTESSRVALYSYLQPVVASVVAVWFMGERLTWRTGLSGGLIFAGFLVAFRDGALTSETKRKSQQRLP